MGLLLFEIPTLYGSAFLRSPFRGLGASLLAEDTAHSVINILVNVVSVLYISLYVNVKHLFRKIVNIFIYYFLFIRYIGEKAVMIK